jgi:hypothetical protein
MQAFADVLNTQGETSGTPPAEDGTGGGAGEEPAKPAQSAGEDSSPAPADASSTQPPDRAEGEGADALAGLREQVQKFLSTAPKEPVVEAAKPAQPQAQPQTQEPAKPAGQPAGYNLHIPDQIMEALDSDDRNVRRQGLAALTNGMMNILVRDFGTALAHLKEELAKELPEKAAGRATAEVQQQQMREDFYGAFPKLKEMVTAMPALEGPIWQQIHETAQKMGQKQWTPQFRDGAGAMIHLALGVPVEMKTAPKGPTPGARAPAKGQYSTGGAQSRGNGAASGNEFLDVLRAGTG